ncbi:MAG TPA: LOG family protein [Chlamydiales bacterium]|nr:LOG family protein [Chlamydiales bacterium]
MNENTLYPHHYDLVTPDGFIVEFNKTDEKSAAATIRIENIFPGFIGYQIDPASVFFNLKSTLAQIGLEGISKNIRYVKDVNVAYVELELKAYGKLAKEMLKLLQIGTYIGKLFAADEKRRVRDPDYLLRMIGRSDTKGRPLLSLGGLEGSRDLVLEKNEGRTVAFLSLRDGKIFYSPLAEGFLPTLALALRKNMAHTRQLLHLHQKWVEDVPRIVSDNEILLVRTAPLHVRTVYARVVNQLLPPGFFHTSANVLQPDTTASGDIYELYGKSQQIIDDIPLEFYTLEPQREYVFFSDRDQLLASLEQPQSLFDAFATAPEPKNLLASVFVVKGTQMQALQAKDWITREPIKHDFPGLAHPSRQAIIVEKYIEHQPQYPFLKAIESGLITSQGILLSRYFPTPLLKQLLLNDLVGRCLKRIYFELPSLSSDSFFSNEDRALLLDLAKFGIPVYWVDSSSKEILQFVLRNEKESGLFVPLSLVETFRKATMVGVYGTNLQEGGFEQELSALLQGLLSMREEVIHPLLTKDIPLALVTGGGPGAMALGNRVAKTLNILSCANIVDFRAPENQVVNEQTINPYIQAKMTYRLNRLVERQAEFYLDLPIFLPGGIGTDFEYALEEVRRKTGSAPANPILLFGPAEYWTRKVTSRFQLNKETGTISGSEWVSNCFFCVQTAAQGLTVYRHFFEGNLLIGKKGPVYDNGFCIVPPEGF